MSCRRQIPALNGQHADATVAIIFSLLLLGARLYHCRDAAAVDYSSVEMYCCWWLLLLSPCRSAADGMSRTNRMLVRREFDICKWRGDCWCHGRTDSSNWLLMTWPIKHNRIWRQSFDSMPIWLASETFGQRSVICGSLNFVYIARKNVIIAMIAVLYRTRV